MGGSLGSVWSGQDTGPAWARRATIPGMTIVGAPSAPVPAVTAPRSAAAAMLVPLATIVVLVALALLPLLTPSPCTPCSTPPAPTSGWGRSRRSRTALSDATVRELVLGPGTFAITAPEGGPFYGPDEAAHLRDARLLLWLVLGAGAIAAAGLALRLVSSTDRAATWRGIARGGAIVALGTVAIGVVGWFAFEPLFELFHRIAFPGGNWAFDPRSQRLVQLYPFAFWELAAAGLGLGMVLLGGIAWVVGRRAGRSSFR